MQPKTQIERLEELEHKIDRLKVSYEKYFRGVDRREPWPERREVERLVRDFLRDPPRTTATRFRFANLRQRLTSLETYWNRVARQIEEGTFERDVRRARRRLEERPTPSARRDAERSVALDLDDDLDLDALFAEALSSVNERPAAPSPAAPPQRPASPPAPARPAPPPPPKAAPPPPPKAAPPPPPKAAPPPVPMAPSPAKAAPPPPPKAAGKQPPPPPPPPKKPT